ncbi:hypothetical protein CDD81_6232 [Ophiocordyceps australis]|uniref:Uncharacterized protein n=1 Tax=Ophiocordyceps australis TaxID=1399860 RepID=A0A2C5Y8H1_9HYPO|nr:hypothetical protein CDD81_6232 [Ophiocordyceps australis]
MTKRCNGLETSIWAAPRCHSQPPRCKPRCHDFSQPLGKTSGQIHALSRAHALQRFEQTCGRIRWKAIDLSNAYGRTQTPSHWSFSTLDAERNFKVDFHEFYIWIEQAVVLLLRVFGTTIDARPGQSTLSATHAFHHNVLMALSDELHPLHESLGTGDVKHALWKAKELRNRWKDVAEGQQAQTPPLKMYDLEWIVAKVMTGLDSAYAVAAQRVRQDMQTAGVDIDMQQAQAVQAEDEWQWMVEPMDWEANDSL